MLRVLGAVDDGVAIIGAGWLGVGVAHACPGPTLATTRSGRRPPDLAATIAVVALDLLGDGAALEAGVMGARTLGSASTWVFAIAPGPDQDRRALYVEGPARMLAMLGQTQVRRVVWIGSTSALPDLDGPVDETCTTWPEEPRGHIQREAEQAIERACAAAKVSWMVLRMGGLYGPGREIGRLFGGRAPLGDGARATNLIHRDDAISATVAAVASDRSGVVHVVDDDHCTRRAMIDGARAAAGLPPPVWPGSTDTEPRGKCVDNGRLGAWLGVTLQHPRHSPLAPPRPRA